VRPGTQATVGSKSFDVNALDIDAFWYDRSMPRPTSPPIGLKLSSTAKTVGRAFEDAMAAAGGSLPIWLILISLKTQRLGNQRELAEAIGIQGATLTHHLNAMETNGLLTRRRHPDNRRIHIVEPTNEGDALFLRLRTAAVAFDQQLRAGLSEEEIAGFYRVLERLRHNVTGVGTANAASGPAVPG
jgi:MarR family transcriptional regulator, transcriptional regulator for hemolysin